MTLKILSTQVSKETYSYFNIRFNILEKLNNFFSYSKNKRLALKYSASRSIFTKTVRFERKLNEITFFVIVKVTPALGALPWITYICFTYFTSDLGNATFETPFPMWNPFDWKNPVGFSIVITVQYMIFSYIFFISACHFNTALGSHAYSMSASKCIKQNFFAIDQSVKVKAEQKQILGQFIEFIGFHSGVKQLSSILRINFRLNNFKNKCHFIQRFQIRKIHDFSGIFQQFVAIVFAWSLINICSALLMLQLEMVKYFIQRKRQFVFSSNQSPF